MDSEFAVEPPSDVIILLLPALFRVLIATTTVLNVLSPAKNVVLFLVPLPRRARGTVPDVRLDAFRLDTFAPLPYKVSAKTVLHLTELVPKSRALSVDGIKALSNLPVAVIVSDVALPRSTLPFRLDRPPTVMSPFAIMWPEPLMITSFCQLCLLNTCPLLPPCMYR